jgi:hypothetical protein
VATAASYYLGYYEIRHLAAAQGLLVRWLEAAAEGADSEPASQELVALLRRRRGKLDWPATRQLASAQTGRTPEELARPSAAELEGWRTEAWAHRADDDYFTRVRALRTLHLLGLPTGIAPADLIESLHLSEPIDDLKRYSLWEAVAGAVSRSGRPELARAVLQRLDEDRSAYSYAYTTRPELWELVAENDRETALGELLSILRDDLQTLVVQEAADRALQRLTRRTSTWNATATDASRRAAIARWEQAIDEGLPPSTAGARRAG